LDEVAARDIARRALLEDRAAQDVTTPLLGDAATRPARARFVAEERCVVAGVPLVAIVFRELEAAATVEAAGPEGAWVAPGAAILSARARAATLLGGERVALNLLQRLCGIATLTRQTVDAVAGTPARITHTRKTTPGLRSIERYAVRLGGGVDNRGSLADAVMWKDNHWALLGGRTLRDALAAAPPGVAVIVEVETRTQLDAALAAGVAHVLIDNQPPEQLAAWVRDIRPGVTVQASGGIGPHNARAYAEAGATLISIGALTHSAPAAPISCAVSVD
jgi:nicotinate-nucleotide pyrophosphorylase (carboxylating)